MSQYEYLGMIIKEKLNMVVQIESMYKKANKKLGIMSRVFGFISVKMKYNFSNLTKLHNSPFYRGVKLWNKLPEKIQKCNVKREFRKLVPDWIK